jgi:hypothetical protein
LEKNNWNNLVARPVGLRQASPERVKAWRIHSRFDLSRRGAAIPFAGRLEERGISAGWWPAGLAARYNGAVPEAPAFFEKYRRVLSKRIPLFTRVFDGLACRSGPQETQAGATINEVRDFSAAQRRLDRFGSGRRWCGVAGGVYQPKAKGEAMIRWIGRLLYLWLWGAPPPKPDTPLNVGSNRLSSWTFGNVVMHVFLNRTAQGRPYFKVIFRKLIGKGRDQRETNSFFIEDLADVERCIARIRLWLHDNEQKS